MKKLDKKHKVFYFVISIVLSFIFCINVGHGGSSNERMSSFGQSNKLNDTYVLDNIHIDYRYDKSIYEVESFVNQPYAVIKGNAQVINKMRLMKQKPKFYVDLTGKKPGTYQEKIKVEGLDTSAVSVSVYPVVAELKLHEQQTVKYTPIIELSGTDKVDSSKYVVGSPTIVKPIKIRIRDMQYKLGEISQVKGVINVSNLKENTILNVKLHAYDRKGNVMSNVNLIDTSVLVKIPINNKVVVQENKVIPLSNAEKKKLENEREKLEKLKFEINQEKNAVNTDKLNHAASNNNKSVEFSKKAKEIEKKESELSKREAQLKEKELKAQRMQEAALEAKEEALKAKASAQNESSNKSTPKKEDSNKDKN